MFERRLYYHIDWVLIGAVLAICALGLSMIYSTTGGAGRVYWTQIYALGLGLIAMAVCLTFDYRSLADKSHWIYLAMMVLLVGVLFFGAVRGGLETAPPAGTSFASESRGHEEDSRLIRAIASLLAERSSLAHDYDVGPEGRFGGQRKAFALILEHPLGIGSQEFTTSYHHEEVHNVYLSLLLNAGWLGGAAYLLLVVTTLQAGIRQCVRPGPLQAPQIVATAAFLGLALEGFVIDIDHWRHFFILQACVFGLADCAARVEHVALRPDRTVTRRPARQVRIAPGPAEARPLRRAA